jgi:hypothetical protein
VVIPDIDPDDGEETIGFELNIGTTEHPRRFRRIPVAPAHFNMDICAEPEKGEMEPGPVTNLGPQAHSENYINV